MTKAYKYFSKENIPSLEEVLANREERIYTLRQIEESYQPKSTLCFKLNIPGEQKINPALVKIFDLGIEEIKKSVKGEQILFEGKKIEKTGPEFFLSLDMDPLELKQRMVALEENSYFGRLYDMDIVSRDINITRDMIGQGPRKCFLCDKDAKVCARSRAHSLDEMIRWIEDLIDAYEERQ